MTADQIAALVNVAISQLPGLFAWIRGAHAQTNPGVPPPTDAEVIAALQAAVASSIARDNAWLAARPE